MKIALGTVQFGSPYGTFNRVGQVSVSEVDKILEVSMLSGVHILDTAHAYGTSESVLGQLGAGGNFRIVTKVPALSATDPITELKEFFKLSLQRLRVNSVYGLLLHRAADLLGENGLAIWRTLEKLRECGLVSRIGFSAYGPEEALALLQRYPVQIIQLPLNVFDNRHLDSGVLDVCALKDIEVHVRSVFLQGFALSDPDRLVGNLSQWRELLARFHYRCAELQVTPLQAALHHVISLSQVDQIVVGVDGVAQLTEILQATNINHLSFKDIGSFRCLDLSLIDPSRWK